MLELFTETTGKQRLCFGLTGIAINLALLFFADLIWFWLWAIAIVLLISSSFGSDED